MFALLALGVCFAQLNDETAARIAARIKIGSRACMSYNPHTLITINRDISQRAKKKGAKNCGKKKFIFGDF